MVPYHASHLLPNCHLIMSCNAIRAAFFACSAGYPTTFGAWLFGSYACLEVTRPRHLAAQPQNSEGMGHRLHEEAARLMCVVLQVGVKNTLVY